MHAGTVSVGFDFSDRTLAFSWSCICFVHVHYHRLCTLGLLRLCGDVAFVTYSDNTFVSETLLILGTEYCHTYPCVTLMLLVPSSSHYSQSTGATCCQLEGTEFPQNLIKARSNSSTGGMVMVAFNATSNARRTPLARNKHNGYNAFSGLDQPMARICLSVCVGTCHGTKQNVLLSATHHQCFNAVRMRDIDCIPSVLKLTH